MKIIENIYNSKNSTITISIILFLWVAWVLYPLLGSGFIGDDAYNSLIYGAVMHENTTLWDKYWFETKGWALTAGRIFGYHHLHLYYFHYFFTNPFTLKAITLFLIFVDIVLFSQIVKALTKNRNLSYLFAFLIPLFFQFRAWHDPILTLTFIWPTMCIFFFSSILFLMRYLDEKKISSLILFLFMYLMCLLTYEISYAFVSVYLVLILFYGNIKIGAKPFLLSLTLLFLHMFLAYYFLLDRIEAGGTTTYPGSKLNLNLFRGLEALYVQVSATIPLSWKFATSLSYVKKDFFKIGLENIIVYSFFSTLFCTYLFRINNFFIQKKILIGIVLFSLALIFGPAFGMAVSGHQKELIDAGFGYGYTPVFIQYFGLGLLALLGFLYFIQNISKSYLKKSLFVTIWVLIFIVGAVTREENFHVVEASNKFYKYPREFLGEAIDAGLFNNVKDRDVILSNQRYPSDIQWFFATKTKRRIIGCSLNRPDLGVFPKCIDEWLTEKGIRREGSNYKDKPFKVYALSYYLGSEFKGGSAILAEIEDVILKYDVPIGLKFKNYYIFNSTEKNPFTYSKAKYYDFVKILRKETYESVDSIGYQIEDYAFHPVLIAFKGFFSREGPEENYLRWSPGKSTVTFFNSSDKIIKKRFAFRLIRPGSDVRPAKVRVSYENKHENFEAKPRILNPIIYINLALNPGSTSIEFTSESKFFNNGDPRKIVYGIGNYKLLEMPSE